MKNGGYRGFRNLKVVGYFTGRLARLCNSRIAEIVLDEYSRLELLGLEGIINWWLRNLQLNISQFLVCRSVSAAGW